MVKVGHRGAGRQGALAVLVGALLLASSVTLAVEPPAPAVPESALPSVKPEKPGDPAQEARDEVKPGDLIKRHARTDIDEMILRGASTIPISTLVDETIDDLVHDLNALDVTRVSPMAIRTVEVSPNLKATFAHDLENRVIAAIAQATTIKQVSCAECRALRSHVENGEWVVKLGPVNQKDLAQLGESLAVRSFLEIDFSFESGLNAIITRARLVRASDSAVLWSESYTSDTSTASLLRGRDRIQSRDERRDELQRLIEARPSFGYAAMLGVTFIPWGNPERNPLTGITGGFRLFERFGPQKKQLFGLDVQGFVNVPAPLLGAFAGMTYQYEITDKSLLLPEIRVGGTIGGFVVGSEGNSFFGEAGVEVMMKFRLGLGASLFYMLPVTYRSFDLGGLGYRVKMMFVW
jgi:hypothetical protein